MALRSDLGPLAGRGQELRLGAELAAGLSPGSGPEDRPVEHIYRPCF